MMTAPMVDYKIHWLKMMSVPESQAVVGRHDGINGMDRHQTLKNRILLKNHYLPGDLEASIGAFVEHYNHHRYHESLGNLTPADVYFGRDWAIIERRRKIKKQTFEKRRLAHQRQAA